MVRSLEDKQQLEYDGDNAQQKCMEGNKAQCIPEVSIIRLYDECVKKAWHRDNKNGNKDEKHAGGNMYAVHGLLQIRVSSNDHSQTGNENKVEHYAAHQTVFDNDLAVSIEVIVGIVFKQAWVVAVFVEEGYINGNFYHCVANGISNEAVERFCFAAETVQGYMHEVSERNDGDKSQHKVNGGVALVMKPLVRWIRHVAANDQWNSQHAQIQHDNVDAKHGVQQMHLMAES